MPTKWQKHGDIILFPDSSFKSKFWLDLPSDCWAGWSLFTQLDSIAVIAVNISIQLEESIRHCFVIEIIN